ncbi:MAG: hypothetical protein EBS42_00710 [Caulobacteraceae bacterium]|nr:hypothetical protein [Caulobacteraceae bacterium]
MMMTKSVMVAALGVALLAGQASAQSNPTGTSAPAARSLPTKSLERATAPKGRINRQVAEMTPEMIVFVTAGVVLVGGALYSINDNESGKSPK